MATSVASFATAIRAARSLCDGDTDSPTANDQYVRGQAELICDMFGLDTDDFREEITELIRPERKRS